MRDIPRHEWPAFLDSFSRQHDRWLATIEVHGAGMGAQAESREQPLIGITAELRAAGDDAISILIGGSCGEHVAHLIHAPQRVRLEETEEGAHEALHIETRNGATTVLRFRATILLELLDGEVFWRERSDG